MQNLSKKIISLFLFLAVGCVSNNLSQPGKELSGLDTIKIGGPQISVLEKLGSPSQKNLDGEEESWIYNNTDELQTQKSAVTLNIKAQSVTSVTEIVNIDLDEFIKARFPQITLTKLPLKRCGKHYYPLVQYHVNIESGLIFSVDRLSNTLDSFSRTTSQFVSDFAQKIKACPY